MRGRHIVSVAGLVVGLSFAGWVRADLVSWWKFDGDLLDSGPGANHGTYGPAEGTPTFVAGMDGSALNFNGTSDFVRVAQTTKLPAHDQPVFTIAFWVKGPAPSATPYDRKVFSEASTSTNTPLWNLGTANASGNQKLDAFVRTDANAAPLNHPKTVANVFDNAWHHVAWVDDNGTVSCYVDGVRDTTSFNYTRAALTTNTTTFGAIERAAVSNWVTAVVDDMRFYDHALSLAEVLELSQVGCPGLAEGDTTCTGLTVAGPPASAPGVWTFSATASDVSGDAALLYSWVVKDAADTVVFTRANSTDASIAIGLGAGSYTVSVTVDDDRRCLDVAEGATCTQTVEVVADAPRLVSRYPLDGDANDTEASGNHGTIVSGADATPAAFVDGWDGTPGGAIALSGDDYINVSTATSLPLYVYPSYSVALWAKGLPQQDKRMYSEGSSYDSSPLVNVGTDNTASPDTTGKVDIFIRNNTGAGNPINHRKSDRIAQDDTWHHIVWVDDGGWASVYVDGVRDAVDVNYVRGALVANRVSIGGILRATAGSFYTGAIDDVRLYNYALSAEEVSALVPEPAGCPGDADTHATGLTVAGPEGDLTGTWTATATGTDDSGDPVLFTFVFKDSEGRILRQFGPTDVDTASLDLAPGSYTVSVTADDALLCKDQAADATKTVAFQVRAEPPLEVANWLFDGSLADGISGSEAVFLGVDGPTWGEGRECLADGALVLDGVDDLIQAGANDGLPLTKKADFSIAFWVKGPQQGDRRIFSESSATDTNFLYNLGTANTGASGALDFYFRDGTGAAAMEHRWSTTPVMDGSWHHVVWSDANGTVTCWIDGVQDATDFSYVRPASLTQSITTIGGIYRPTRDPPASSWLAGSVDDVRLYNYILSEAEVLALFGDGPSHCCPVDGDTHCGGLTIEGPAGGTPGTYTATASATDDSGDAIVYTFTATPAAGDPIVVGPQAGSSASFQLAAGSWTIAVAVDDDPLCDDVAGDSTCSSTVDVVEGGGNRRPLDINVDGKFDISDPIGLLNFLFLGGAAPPCGEGALEDPGNIVLLDSNGDEGIDLSDAVTALNFLFLGGARPTNCLDDTCPCLRIVGCSEGPCD